MVKFVTTSELLNGFSDTQIQELMNNMTIFMPMDGCPSPCDICALEAKKTVNSVMDFSLIKHLYTNFPQDFNRSPSEHANDQLAYHGQNSEDFSDILALHRDFLTDYPRVWTAFPRGSAKVLEKILNMDFVSENHPNPDPNSQTIVPAISRHVRNRRIVDRYTKSLVASERFVEKRENDEKNQIITSISYFLETLRGVRELKVREIEILPIGTAEKYSKSPNIDVGGFYQIGVKVGVAVLPTGFYEYRGGLDCSYRGILKRRITPQNFHVPEIKDLVTYISRHRDTGETLHLLMRSKAYK